MTLQSAAGLVRFSDVGLSDMGTAGGASAQHHQQHTQLLQLEGLLASRTPLVTHKQQNTDCLSLSAAVVWKACWRAAPRWWRMSSKAMPQVYTV
jgi:hypothetical protein